jgi:LPXTG-site transpeptidase (sortase) family protein
MAEFNFDFDYKPKRPLWKDLRTFCATVFVVWGTTQFSLNYDAFAQIATFKAKELQTSIIQTFSPEEETELKIKTVNTKRTVFKNSKIKPQNQSKKLFSTLEINPPDNRIFISKIGKNVPLVTVPVHKNWNQLENNIQKGLQNGVVVHPVSRPPGTFGNFFLTGHSSYYAWDNGRFKDVFALLHEMEIGDEVEVFWKNKKYKYQIQSKEVVSPTKVDVLNQPNDKSIITLMTCTPVGTNKNRLILVGELVEE